MSDGIYSALSGAVAQERNLTVVANNVANATTSGYKADRTVFAEVMRKAQSKLPTAPSLSYTVVNQLAIDTAAGTLKQTSRPLDVALQGDGYFAVQTPQGERYTRAGSFVMDGGGVLRTLGGYPVLQQQNGPVTQPGAPIVIPQDAQHININPDGTVIVDANLTTDGAFMPNTGTVIGKLKLVSFANGADDLKREGLTLFTTQPNVQPQPVAATTTVEQGYLEAANINAVSGMNELITVQRSFEALEKVIDTFKDLDNRTAQDVDGRA